MGVQSQYDQGARQRAEGLPAGPTDGKAASVDRDAYSRVEVRTGQDQLEAMLVRAAYFSVCGRQPRVLPLAPAGLCQLGGPCCLWCVIEG
jgi:hypothetical protein